MYRNPGRAPSSGGGGGISITIGGSSTPSSLPEPESKVVLIKINTERAQLSGPNKQPLPSGNVVPHENGSKTLITKDGRRIEVRKNATVAAVRSKDVSATFFTSGRVASLHTSSMDIHSGPLGEKTIVSRRPDQSVLVRTGPHSGYLERPVLLPDNQQIVLRTYVRNGTALTRTYTTYVFHGVTLLHYVPQQYSAPGMYGWAYYPWKPMPFQFGSAGIPGSVSGQAYFAPTGTYSSGYSWLTDFDLTDMMQRFNEMQATEETQSSDSSNQDSSSQDSSNPNPSNQDPSSQNPPNQNQPTEANLEDHIYSNSDAPITPTIKDAIAEEVRTQLAMANTAASGQGDPKSGDLPQSLQLDHVFVVSSLLEVNARDEQTCSLRAGDVLQLAAPVGANDTEAQTKVASSHRADCPVGEIVAVSLQDLQQMQNDLRAEMDDGLRALRDNQGKEGWPQAPKSALAAPPHPSFDGLPGADPQAGDLIQAQKDEVAKAEHEVYASAYAKD